MASMFDVCGAALALPLRLSGLHPVSHSTCSWYELPRHAGRFGFVEMRSEELASSAMQLDKVEVCGRQINVGRPKGYTEPPGGAAPAASLNAAQIFAASLARRPSTVLLLENMLKAYQLHDDSERNDVRFQNCPLQVQQLVQGSRAAARCLVPAVA